MQQEKLIKILKLWLKKNDLDTDLTFYTKQEWRKRLEEYHNDADFIITTEGGLNFVLNYGNSDEFYDIINSFNYYCEMGHSWNVGFYKDDDDDEIISNKNYSELLKDIRWKNKREYILKRAMNKCEDCYSNSQLEIHHCYYIYNFQPWEYPYDALRCLCRSCHEKRGPAEFELRGHLASLKTDEIISIVNLLSTGLYWYPKDEMFNFLKSFNYDQEKTKQKFDYLMTQKIKNEH